MNVSEHRKLKFIFNPFQNAQTFSDSGAAKAANRSTVGLVVTGFENKRQSQSPGHALDDLRHAHGVLFALDDTRTGNQKKIA